MYGVPNDLDLTFLHRTTLIQIRLGQFQVQFHFHPVGTICVDGSWELIGAAGEMLDRSYDDSDRPPYELHRLLGREVTATEIHAPKWFSVEFETGEVLRVFDDSETYESFQIQPGDIVV